MSEKKILASEKEIEAALKQGFVFASVPHLSESQRFVVRDVRREKDGPEMVLKVRLLEGWFKPAEVWAE